MPKQVILADDSQIYRETVIAQLECLCERENISAKFDQASDGKELVDKVVNCHYDLVFTDIIR